MSALEALCYNALYKLTLTMTFDTFHDQESKCTRPRPRSCQNITQKACTTNESNYYTFQMSFFTLEEH